MRKFTFACYARVQISAKTATLCLGQLLFLLISRIRVPTWISPEVCPFVTRPAPLQVSVIQPTSSGALVMLFARADILGGIGDRKSTRLNSSHSQISYAVFCLKK